MADEKNTDEEFAGFDNLDESYTDPAADEALLEDEIDDAEFQDMADVLNDDVFEDEQPADTKPKKKVNWFNIIVALVAVLVAGGLIASKIAPQLLSGGAPVETPAPEVATPNNPANAEAAAQAALAPQLAPGAPTGGMLDNPDAFAELAQGAVPDPAKNNTIPDPFAAMSKAQPTENSPEAAPVMPDVPMPAPIAPAVDTTETLPAVPAAPVTPVVAEATPIPAAQAVAVDTAAVSAVQGQVDLLSTRMDSIESKLDAALAKTQTLSTSVPADDARFDRIQSALERLESRIDDMASARRSTPVAVADDQPAPVKKAKKSTKAKKAPTTSYDEPYKPAPTAAVTPVAAASASGWTLRGAQPGQAIIGQVGGDIRQISIGDMVPGVGQVTGIAPINGRWVVQGTQGRISQ